MESLQSILAIDCGASFTKAVLMEKSGARFRVSADAVSLSTHQPPWKDVVLGVHDAIAHLEATTDKTLLSANGREITGADAVAVVSSAGEPLRVILAGTTTGGSLQTARRAVASAFALPVAEFAFDDAGESRRAQSRIAKMQHTSADVLLLVGGIDGGIVEPVLDLAQVLTMALQTLPAPRRPSVIFAGNKALRAQMAGIFGKITDYKPVDNILPALGMEHLDGVRVELEILQRQKWNVTTSEEQSLAQWANTSITPTATSFSRTIHFLGQTSDINILGVNIGSLTATLAGVMNGIRHTFIVPNGGVAANHNPSQMSALAKNIQRWLPFELSTEQLRIILHNRAIYPQTIPTNSLECMIEFAILSEVLQDIHKNRISGTGVDVSMPDVLIVAGQPFTAAVNKKLTVLALLNGLKPAGIFTVAAEKHHLLGVLGAIAELDPVAAVDLSAFDALEKLTTVIAPVGDGQPGDVAVKLSVSSADGITQSKTVRAGDIAYFPETAGEMCEVTLTPGHNFHVQAAPTGGKITVSMDGGTLGLIVDARRSAIPEANTEAKRKMQWLKWLAALGIESQFDGKVLPYAASNPTN